VYSIDIHAENLYTYFAECFADYHEGVEMTPPDPVVSPPISGKSSANFWAVALTVLSVLGLIIVLVILFTGALRLSSLQLWGILTGVILFLLMGLGNGANGKWYGFLIDSRNRTSLSRLQISLWTILTLSAFLAIALPRSVPRALGDASEKAITQCRADYLKETEKIGDIEALRTTDSEAAEAAEERAALECIPDPLNIRFPEELLLALGISTASFTGSTLILSNKRNKSELGLTSDLKRKIADAEKTLLEKQNALNQVNKNLGDANLAMTDAQKTLNDPSVSDKTQAQKELDGAKLRYDNEIEKKPRAEKEFTEAKQTLEGLQSQLGEFREGLLKVNKTPQEATLSDMFQGDETGDYYLVDLSKVQMFFFTVAIVVAYAAALAAILNDQAALMNPLGVDFPSFSSSLNALLAISHAGYLTVKSVDHTKTT
jgi:hypothetical protein